MIALVLRRDGLFELRDVEAEGVVAIDEHDPGADFGNGADGGIERVRRRDDLVAGTDAKRAQRNLQRIGAGPDADRVLDAERGRKQLLEFLRPACRA